MDSMAVANIKTQKKSQFAWRNDFWHHMISRHPIEEDYAKATANSSRWRTVPRHRIVIAQYIAENGVGVFIRGERGQNSADLQQRLSPYTSTLKKALGPGLLNENEPEAFFHSRKHFNALDENNWDKMADWLHKKADKYQVAIQRVMGGMA